MTNVKYSDLAPKHLLFHYSNRCAALCAARTAQRAILPFSDIAVRREPCKVVFVYVTAGDAGVGLGNGGRSWMNKALYLDYVTADMAENMSSAEREIEAGT